MRPVLALAAAEARLIRRNTLVGVTALLMPFALGVALATLGDGDHWGNTVAMQVLMVLLFGLYAAATTALAARRRQLVLKRLRSGELSDSQILAGLLAPLFALTLAQSLLLIAIAVGFGAPAPSRPWLLIPALGLGSAMAAALALATAAFTSSAELAQITVVPVFFAAIAGATWTLSVLPDAVEPLMHVVPGGALADLVRQAWDAGGDPLLACVALLAWTAAGAAVARRWFRWAPR